MAHMLRPAGRTTGHLRVVGETEVREILATDSHSNRSKAEKGSQVRARTDSNMLRALEERATATTVTRCGEGPLKDYIQLPQLVLLYISPRND